MPQHMTQLRPTVDAEGHIKAAVNSNILPPHSWTLAGYAAAVMVAFHLRVVMGEEPWLEKTHGQAWQAYRARVPRWIGRPGRTENDPA